MKQLTIIGNLGADATLQMLNGKECVTFRIADTEKYVNNQGQTVENTTWYDCIWNNSGGKLLSFLRAGARVYVAGVPTYRIYDSAKYHTKMVGVSITVRQIELVGGSNDNVPRMLITADGEQVLIKKYYHCGVQAQWGKILHDKNMKAYGVDENGFVQPFAGSTETAAQGSSEPPF